MISDRAHSRSRPCWRSRQWSSIGPSSSARRDQQQRERVQERERQQAEQRQQQERREAEQRVEQERQQEAEAARGTSSSAARPKSSSSASGRRPSARPRRRRRQTRTGNEGRGGTQTRGRDRTQAEGRSRAPQGRGRRARCSSSARRSCAIRSRRKRAGAQAENAGLLNQYIAMIEQRIVRNWNRPPSARHRARMPGARGADAGRHGVVGADRPVQRRCSRAAIDRSGGDACFAAAAAAGSAAVRAEPGARVQAAGRLEAVADSG